MSKPLRSEKNRICLEPGTDKEDPKKFLERIGKVNQNAPFNSKLLLNYLKVHKIALMFYPQCANVIILVSVKIYMILLF